MNSVAPPTPCPYLVVLSRFPWNQVNDAKFIIIPLHCTELLEFGQCDQCGPRAEGFPLLLRISLLPVTPEMHYFQVAGRAGISPGQHTLPNPTQFFTVVTI